MQAMQHQPRERRTGRGFGTCCISCCCCCAATRGDKGRTEARHVAELVRVSGAVVIALP